MGSSAQGPNALIGQVVAGYRLERVLGIGATGAVFLGARVDAEADTPTDGDAVPTAPPSLPATAAIKLLYVPWQLADEQAEEFRLRFLREAQTLSQLQHPHLLPVLASGQDTATGHLYMVMPHIAGTLASRLTAAGALPLQEASSILDQLAGALDYAHSQGVIHRDIKPANILLDEQGHVYLGDFGILRLLDESRTRLTTTGGVLGTPEYMAPEQARGEEVGPAADRYALAVVLYQMVTGHLPFKGGTPATIIVRQMQDPPPIPRSYRADLPEPAEAVILKGLAKLPADRFALSSQMAEAFALGLTGILSPLVTPTGPQQAQTLNDGRIAETPATPLPWAPYPEAPALAAGTTPQRQRKGILWGSLGAAVLLLLTAAVLAALVRPDLVQEVFGGKTATVTVAATQGQAAQVTETLSPTTTTSPTATAAATSHVLQGTITEFMVPTAHSYLAYLTSGPDHALWFTEYQGNKIGRITPSGAITEYQVPTAGSAPNCITLGPDGALWFTESAGNQIGRITTSGQVTEYPVSTPTSYPAYIVAGPDGALWFTEYQGNKIGRITPSGAITEYDVAAVASGPSNITVGPDGALWFTAHVGADRIGRITTSGQVTVYSLPATNTDLPGIAVGSDGAIWFTELNTNKIGRITIDGTIAEYSVPTANGNPRYIAAGPDGALWFTEIDTDKIGRITTSGQFTEYRVPTADSNPSGIATGPDGSVWFNEIGANQIGRLD